MDLPSLTLEFDPELRGVLGLPEDVLATDGTVRDAGTLLRLIDPDDRAFTGAALAWARDNDGETGRLGFRIRRDDGGWLPVTARCHGGRDKVVLSLTHDDSEVMRRSESKLRQVVEGARQAATVRVGSKAVYANAALAPLLGYRSQDEMRKVAAEVDHLHPDDRAMVARRQADRLAGRQSPSSFEFRMVRVDGRVIWVEAFVSQISWGGEPATLAWLVDITARKHAEEAVRRSEELFGVLFRACPDMMLLINAEDGRIVDANDSFLKVTGYDIDKVMGRTGLELQLLADPSVVRQLFMLAEHGLKDTELDATINLADGGQRLISVSARHISFASNNLILFVARDVTARRRQEQALQESKQAAELANRAKSEFLANMSHELRTPLNAVIGFSEIIANEVSGPVGTPVYREYALDIRDSGRHLLQIINDILDLSKLEAGKLELQEKWVRIDDLVANCIRIVSHRAEEADINLSSDPVDATLECMADARQLKQVMFNLLSNAIKFTPPAGTVTVSAAIMNSGNLRLTIEDTGHGMSASDIETSMQAFGQVASGRARRHQGTGLGLPIVKSLVELHGGQFTLESTPGEGTKAIVLLPEWRVQSSGKSQSVRLSQA